MKKLVFFIESLEGGGAERSLTELVENIDRDKFSITVITETDSEIYTERVKSACNLRCLTIKGNRKNYISYNYNRLIYKFINTAPRKIAYKVLIGNKYDVEIAYCEGFATKLIAASSNKKSKKIAFVHTDMQNNHWSQIHYADLETEKDCYAKFDTISCVSQTVASAFNRTFGMVEKTVVCYNPVHSDLIKKQSEELLDIAPFNGLRMVTLGRLSRVKAFDRLFSVAKKLANCGYTFELLVLGAGEKEAELNHFLVENDLTGYIKLLGFRSNPYKYIAASDFFVCSSFAEGFSTAAAECIVLGKPIVTTDCSGMSELFGGYECGIICKNSEDALFDALKSVFDNPECLVNFGMNSKKRAESFNLSSSISEIEKLFV